MASKRKRIRVRKKKMLPGMMQNFEDSRYVHNLSSLRSQPNRAPGPRVASSLRVPKTQVRERVITAMKTLRALPDREKRFFIVRSSAPDYIQEYIDAYNSLEIHIPEYRPSPSDVSDCLTALSWVRHLEKRQWQILWWRSFDLSFGTIAEYIGRSDETARKRFDEAITDAWIAANGV